MSSKASEILGVSYSRPTTSRRKNTPTRDAAPSRSSRPTTSQASYNPEIPYDAQSYTSSVRPFRPDRNRRQRSDRSIALSSKPSIDSVQPSVRFADPGLTPRESTSSIRPATDYETALPEVSRRPAPSAWRGMPQKAEKKDTSNGSLLMRPSQESLASKRRQEAVEPSSRSSRSWFSRLTSRSSSNGPAAASASASVRPAIRSTASSTLSSTRPSVVSTAATTPRALSPSRSAIRYPTHSNDQSISTSDFQPPHHQRLNSRMPIDVHTTQRRGNRSTTLEDDGPDMHDPSPYESHLPAETSYPPSHTSVYADYQPNPQARAQYGRFYAGDVSPFSTAPSHSPYEYSTDQQSFRNSPNQSLPTHTTGFQYMPNFGFSPNIPPSSHSILHFPEPSDENTLRPRGLPEAKKPMSYYGEDTKRTTAFATRYHDPQTRTKLGTRPRRDIGGYKTPAAILSVLKIDDGRDASVASLPSLVDSNSSRQNSSISTTSYAWSHLSTAPQVPNSSGLREETSSASGKAAFQAESPPRSPSYESEVQRQVSAMSASMGGGDTPSPVDTSKTFITASISPEEAALLTHIRRQRAQALKQLQPAERVSTSTSPAVESPQEEIPRISKPDQSMSYPKESVTEPVPESQQEPRTGNSEETSARQKNETESDYELNERPGKQQDAEALNVSGLESVASEPIEKTREYSSEPSSEQSEERKYTRHDANTSLKDQNMEIDHQAESSGAESAVRMNEHASVTSNASPSGNSVSEPNSSLEISRRQRQPSVQYLETRSKFEKVSTSPSSTSMLPISSKRQGVNVKDGTETKVHRAHKDISYIPRLRDTKSSRPTSVLRIPEAQDVTTTNHRTYNRDSVIDSNSSPQHGALSPDEKFTERFHQPQFSSAVRTKQYVGSSSEAEESDSPVKMRFSQVATTATSDADQPESNSADDGDDEMAGPSISFASHHPRQNRNSGARYVLEAWHALGGGDGSM